MEKDYEKYGSPPPREIEPICMPSYIVALTRVGGGPQERSGFWPAYREALAVNKKTNYNNARLQICLPIIRKIEQKNPDWNKKPFYYRNGKLSEPRIAKDISALLEN